MQHQSPVYLISGPDQGFLRSSLVTSIGDLLHGVPQGRAALRFYLNIKTQLLAIEGFRSHIVERGHHTWLNMVYNAKSGWKVNLDKRFGGAIPSKPNNGQVIELIEEDGSRVNLRYDASQQAFFSDSDLLEGRSCLSRLYSTNQWALRDARTKTVEFYSDAGLRTRKEDNKAFGLDFEYDSQHRLISIKGDSQLCYQIQYTDTQIKFLREQDARSGNFKLLQIHNLSNTLVNGLIQTSQIGDLRIDYEYITRYVNNGAKEIVLTAAYQNDGSELHFSYGLNPVDHEPCITTIGNGHEIILQCGIDKPDERIFRLNDQSASYFKFKLDEKYRLVLKTEIQSPCELQFPVSLDTHYSYESSTGRLSQITYPDLSTETWTYETSLFSRCIAYTARNGRRESYFYLSPLNPLCEMTMKTTYPGAGKEAALVTRYIYNAQARKDQPDLVVSQCRFILSAAGRVTEFEYSDVPNHAGDVLAKRRYHAYYDIENVPVDMALSMSELLFWRSQQALDQSEYTTYARDHYGQEFQTRTYRQLDADGKGDPNSRDSSVITRQMTSYGQATAVETYTGDNDPCCHYYSYDDVQEQLLSERDSLNRQTCYQYSYAVRDAKQHVTTPAKNTVNRYGIQQIETVLDAYGQAAQQVLTANNADNQAESQKSVYFKLPCGAWLSETLPDNTVHYQLYDLHGRVTHRLLSNGTTEIFNFDDSRRLVLHRRLGNYLDMSPTTPGKPFLPSVLAVNTRVRHRADQSQDRVTMKFYTPHGDIAYLVDEEAYVTENRYDAWDRLIQKIEYATPLNQDQYQALLATGMPVPKADPNQDRMTQYSYDADGILVSERDPGGYLIQHQVNGIAFRCKTEYFNQSNTVDAVMYRFSNSMGECVAEIDSLGYMTTQTYTPFGVLASKTAYSTPLNSDEIAAACLAKRCEPKPGDNDRSEHISYYSGLREKTRQYLVNTTNQRTVTKQYNAFDQIILEEIQGDSYRATAYQYDGFSRCVKTANPNVAALLKSATPDQQIQIWKTQSQRDSYSFGDLRLTRLDSEGYLTQSYYDEAHRLAYEITQRRLSVDGDLLGVVTAYSYNALGDRTSIRHYAQTLAPNSWPVVHNGLLDAAAISIFQKLQSSIDRVQTKVYSRRGLVSQEIDAEQNRTEFDYNAYRLLTEKRLPILSSTPSLIITYQYEARGYLITESHQADALCYTKSAEFASRFSHPTTSTNFLGGVTRFEYNSRGDLVSKTRVDLSHTISCEQWSYDFLSRVISYQDGEGCITLTSYIDSQRRVRTIPSISSNWHELVFNCFGDLVAEYDRLHSDSPLSQYTYSPTGKILTHTDALGHTEQFVYSLNDNQTDYTDKMGRHDQRVYNGSDQMLQETQDVALEARISRYTLNAFNDIILIEDPNHNQIQQDFTAIGLCSSRVRDPNGLKLLQTQTYAANHSPLSLSQGVLDYLETYQLDGFGRQIGVTKDPNGLALVEHQTFNSMDQVVLEQNAQGQAKQTFYDAFGRRQYVMQADGGLIAFAYNGRDQLVSYSFHVNKVSDPSQIKPSSDDHQLWHFYDDSGREVYSVSASGSVIAQYFDDSNQLIKRILIMTALNLDLPFSQLTAKQLDSWVLANTSPIDRVTYYLRDELGQERFILTGAYLVEKRYDSNGRIIQRIEYANSLSEQDIQTIINTTHQNVYAYLKSNNLFNPNHDRLHITQFNHFGEAIWMLSPGDCPSIESQTFRADGLLSLQQHYALGRDLSVFGSVNTDPEAYPVYLTALSQLRFDPNQDRAIEYQYDGANRRTLVLTHDAHTQSPIIERLTYSSFDEILTSQGPIGGIHQRQFDRSKRKIAEISPNNEHYQIVVQNNRLLAQVQPAGRCLTIAYDNCSRQTLVQKGLVGMSPIASASADYDSCSRLSQNTVNYVYVDQADKLPNANFDLSLRPDQMQAVQKQQYYDGRQLQVASVDERGLISFKVYNTENQLSYEIDAHGQCIEYQFNLANEITQITHYAKPLNFDHAAYKTSGLNVDFVRGLITVSSDDRHRVFTYDSLGRRIRQEEGPVYYVDERQRQLMPVSDADYPEASQAVGSLQVPRLYLGMKRSDFILNAFGDVLETVVRVAAATDTLPELSMSEKSRVDQRGNTVLSVSRSGAIKRFFYTGFGQLAHRDEYAKLADPSVLNNQSLQSLSLSDLDALLIHQVSDQDRHYEWTYDLRGNKIQETLKNQSVCVLTPASTPATSSRPVPSVQQVDIIKQYQYDLKNRLVGEQNALGQWRYFYYNDHDQKVAEIGFPMSLAQEDGSQRVFYPLIQYGYNSLGQEVLRRRCYNGAAAIVDPTDGLSFPTPKQLDANKDQTYLYLRDGRGNCLVQQDPNGVLKAISYRADGLVSREWTSDEGYVTQSNLQSRLLETVYDYDPSLNTRVKTTWNQIVAGERQFQDQRFHFSNDFGESIGHARTATGPEHLIKFSRESLPYFDNEGGINCLSLRDLFGRVVAKCQSQTKDLAQLSLDDFNQWTTTIKSVRDLCVQWTLYDEESRPLRVQEPQYFSKIANDITKSLPRIRLCIDAGVQYAFDGNNLQHAISWRKPLQTNMVANSIFLWPVGKPSSSYGKHLPLIDGGLRYWVNADHLTTGSGLYAYTINYSFITELEGALPNTTVCQSSGYTPILNIHGNESASAALIMRDDVTADWVGAGTRNKTLSVFSDNLGKNWVADLPFLTSPDRIAYLDFSNLPSGQYYTSVSRHPKPADIMPPVFVTTLQAPSIYSLSISQPRIYCFETHVEFQAQFPSRYKNTPIQLKLVYQSSDSSLGESELVVKIDPSKLYPTYTDANGRVITAHAELAANSRLISIHSLSVGLEIEPGVVFWLLDDVQPLIGLEPPLDPSQPDHVRGSSFIGSSYLFAQCLSNSTIEIQPVERETYDEWVGLTAINVQPAAPNFFSQLGIFSLVDQAAGAYRARQWRDGQPVDLGIFTYGQYQWALGDGADAVLTELAQPETSMQFDVWNNPQRVRRPGDTEDEVHVYDGQNHLIQKTYPSALVTDNKGNSWSEALNYQYKYDAMGRMLVTQYPSGAEFLTVVDELGNERQRYDASETKPTVETQYDSFALPIRIYDSRRVLTHRDFTVDGRHVTNTYFASGRQFSHVLSSQGHMIEEIISQPGSNPIRFCYDYDMHGNVRQSFLPMGQGTRYLRDTQGEILSLQDAANRVFNYERDYFGRELSFHKPANGVFVNQYDYAGNLIKTLQLSGVGGYRLINSQMKLTLLQLQGIDLRWINYPRHNQGQNDSVYLNELIFTSVQQLVQVQQAVHYSYHPGHKLPVRIFDQSQGYLSFQEFDLQGRIINEKNYRSGADHVSALLDNSYSLIAERHTSFNAFGEVETFFDTLSHGQLLRDRDGNHRATVFDIYTNDSSFKSHNEAWFDYNPAGRVIKANCILSNNEIVIDVKNKQGLYFTYDVDFRVSETDFHQVPRIIQWDMDGRLTTTATDPNNKTYTMKSSINQYDLQDHVLSYEDLEWNQSTRTRTTHNDTSSFNANGWLLSTHSNKTQNSGQLVTTDSLTNYRLDPNLGDITNQNTTYNSNDNDQHKYQQTTDTIASSLIEAGPGLSRQLVKLGGTRAVAGSKDRPPYCEAYQYYDSNGDYVCRRHVDDYASNKQASVYYVKINGRLIETMSLRADTADFKSPALRFFSPNWTPWEGVMLNQIRVFYANRDQVVASYELKRDKDNHPSAVVSLANYISSAVSETARQGGGTLVVGPEFYGSTSAAPELNSLKSTGSDFSDDDWEDVKKFPNHDTEFAVALDFYLTGRRRRLFDPLSPAAQDAKAIADELRSGPDNLAFTDELRSHFKLRDDAGDSGANGQAVWDRIAKAAYKEEGLGALLAQKNGFAYSEAPPIGTVIELPPMLHNTYRSNASPAYQEFVSTIIKSFYPHLEIAKHKEHWWSKLLKIVIAVAAIVVSSLCPAFAPLIALVSDVMMQGISMLDGAQQHFNFTETAVAVAMAFVSQGVGSMAKSAQASVNDALKMGTITKSAAQVLKYAIPIEAAITSAVASQLILLATGMSHKFDLQAIAAAVATAAFSAASGERSSDHFIAAAQTLEDDIVRELSQVVIDNKHFDMTDFLSNSFVDVAGSSIAAHYTDAKPAAQKPPAEVPGRVEYMDGKPLKPSESIAKRDIEAQTREQLNTGIRQSSKQTPAKSNNPTTAALQDGTAYHEKAKFRDAGTAAQRFTQSTNQPSYDWDEVNVLAKSSSLAGNREGLFGRQNKASTAAQIVHGVVAGVEDSLSDLGAKLKHPMKSSSHAAVLSLYNQTKLFADPQDLHPAQDFKDGINRVKSAWQDLSGMSLARKTEALTHGILDNAPYALAGATFGRMFALPEAVGRGGVGDNRLISKIERVSSNIVNEAFISDKAIAEGWKPPYPDNLDIRKITTGREMKLYRVHTDANRPAGRFLAREKELAPFLNDPEALRLHLGLPDVPIYITNVVVPTRTELFIGRIGPQPTFGLMERSGFQYQTVGKLPLSSFTNTRPIVDPKLDFGIRS